MQDPMTSYVLAAQRQLRDDALVRELQKELAWAEHVSQMLAVVAPDTDVISAEVSEW